MGAGRDERVMQGLGQRSRGRLASVAGVGRDDPRSPARVRSQGIPPATDLVTAQPLFADAQLPELDRLVQSRHRQRRAGT